MTANEFAEALRALIGAAEDDGLERPAMIEALAAEVDKAGPASEAGPEGFAEALNRLVTAADAGGLPRADVGPIMLDMIDGMREAEAE